MKRYRVIQLFLVIAAFILCISFISTANGDRPTLYKNDTKYTIEEFPAEKKDGVVYVPVNFFIGFKNVQYQYGDNPAGFYFRNSVTGRYFSFSLTADSIVTDGTLTDVSFPIMNSTVYMPLEYCAEILSLRVEYKSGDSSKIRVSDGTHKLTFDELVELYDPTEAPEDPITPEPPSVEPPSTGPESPEPKDRYLYVTLDECSGEYTSQIIEELEKRDVKATFFFDSDAIKSSPMAVLEAFVKGHSIGITAESPEGLKDTNDALYEILHCYTRIARLGSDITDEEAEALAEAGYLLSIPNIDSEDWSASGSKSAARGIYNKTFEHRVSVIRILADKKSTGIVNQLLYYVSGDEYVTALPLSYVAVTDMEVSYGS